MRLLFLLPPVMVAALGGSLSVSAQTAAPQRIYSGAPVTGRTQYIDPRIGSEGLGRVFIGPSCPFGIVKLTRSYFSRLY